MRFLLIFAFFSIFVFAKEHYAKIEPINLDTIASNVQGEVLEVREDMLGKKLQKTPFIIIDAKLDKVDLRSVKQKIASLQDMIKIDKQIAINLQESFYKKEQNYKSIKNLTCKVKNPKRCDLSLI